MKRMIDMLERMAFSPRRRPAPEAGPQFGDVLERALAAAIDISLLYFLFFDFFQWLSQHFYRHADLRYLQEALASDDALRAVGLLWQGGIVQLWAINSLVQYLIIGFFVVSVQVLWQATPGKWLLGLRIVHYPTLGPVAGWRYTTRYGGYLLATMPAMLGILWIHFNKERRGWHDMLAGTAVIQTRPPGWYWQQVKRGWAWLRRGRQARDDG